MESIEEIYRKWRWLTYNELDEVTLNLMVSGKYPIYQGGKYSDNIYYKKYTYENIERYRTKNFKISEDQIAQYDNNIRLKAKKHSEEDSLFNFAQFYFLRSVFIENCFLIIKNFRREDLINKIKRNIVYFHWWDELSFEELSHCIIDSHFLKSTKKLIDKISLLDYFNRRFNIKEDFINCILDNFIPREVMIREMNEILRGHVMFDYGWLFRNDLTKAIRIFENECRLEFNENIVGSFFNENVLFRTIKKNYGDKFSVISQGSPEWLSPQRFDIYFPEINLAIEYQGEQHEYPVDFGGQGEKAAKKQFEENIKRDSIKKEKAKENDCNILYIYPDYDIGKVMLDLKTAIKERVKNLK